MSALAPAETSARLLIAVLCGALIGINRDLHGKPAGLRTHSLVALGAALAVLASARLAGSGDHQADVVSRVAQGVLTGVGFLGASVDKARWPPASLITLMTGRKDLRTPVLD